MTAWRYQLSNRCAIDWVLDQYKEKKPKDPTIREKFDTYRFKDHKEKVIDLRIVYDGNTLTVAGREPDRDPLVQAKAQAHWLRGLLLESTGRRIEVQPVVVFPGWFVEAAPGAQRAVWVMEPKGLPAFLKNEPQRLTAEDVKLAAYHLARHVRSGERSAR